MRMVQDRLFKSPKIIAIAVTLMLVAVVGFALSQLEEHITKTVVSNMVSMNQAIQQALHRQIDSEVISASQILEKRDIQQALIAALVAQKPSRQQRFMLRILLADSIFPQHYSGFYLVGKNQQIVASMRERDTGVAVPKSAALAIKRLEEGEPSVITHAFAYHGNVHMWLLKPVMNQHGVMIGYFALGLGQEHRFSVTTLGAGRSFSSGETYLVDEQGQMLSESRFRPELVAAGLLQPDQASVLNIRVVDPGVNVLTQPRSFFVSAELPLTLAAGEAIRTRHAGWNADGYNDYRGIASFGVWQWDDYLNAAIITEMDQAEAMSDYVYVRNLLFIVLLIVLLASLVSVIEHSRLRLRLEREDNQHKNLLLESTAEAIYGIDLDGRCTFVNSSFLQLLGYCESEVIGKHIHELIHHSYADGSAYPVADCRILKAQVERRRVHHKGESFWHKHGQPIEVEYWAQPLFEQGKVLGVVVSFLDLEEKRKHGRVCSAPDNDTAARPAESNHEHDPVAMRPADSAVAEGARNLVLVVDDEEMIREVSCVMLKELGYDTLEADDGVKGLDMYEQHRERIVCVLTDLTMPRMDGKEFFSRVKKIDPACRIIICSGYSADHAAQQFVDQHVAAFLQKPYVEDDLRAVMDDVLRGPYARS